jgi:hypothetical protein
MGKCPTCNRAGWKIKNYSKKIDSFRDTISQKTLKMIDETLSKITGNQEYGTDNGEIYFLFKEISEIQGIIIRRGLHVFNEKRLYEAGYGIKYLVGVIKTENRTYEKRKTFEKKYLDRLPPQVNRKGE